jgi:hypothetical protein
MAFGATDDEPLLPAGYDDLVDASPDIDRFCSSSDWVVAAHRSWGAGRTWAVAGRGAALVLARAGGPRGRVVWCGLDQVWGFACPVVGPDPERAAALAGDVLDGGVRWDATLFTGLVPGSPREHALLRALTPRHRVRRGPAMTRQVADLGDGLAAYLARRSARFRRNLARAERARRSTGVELELAVGGGPEIVDRCVAVERRSWKGRAGGGLADRTLAGFYRCLAARLESSGRLRAGFARRNGHDVGYILGAVRHGTYRGLQLSYDEGLAELSLGNLLQLHQMEALVGEDVGRYDLGMDMAYKRHWADEALTTTTLVVQPG